MVSQDRQARADRPSNLLYWLLLLCLCTGCGASAGSGSRLGSEDSPVELTLITPTATYIDVGDYRGEPLLLFVFATFDVNSQAALQPLRELLERRPGLQVIGVAAQVSARPLLAAWVDALNPSFPVGYEPDNRISSGDSTLGEISTVPTWVVLRSDGRIGAKYGGYLSADLLGQLIDEYTQ